MDAANPKGAGAPFYLPQADECDVFGSAFRNRLPLLLKGPTGCGKTRYVAHMAAQMGRPLYTVACHDDLSAADLIGRYLLKGGETVWVDGPLTRAVREGAICYLDEVVEARKDVAVVLHPLTDDRRILPIDRTGELLGAVGSTIGVVARLPMAGSCTWATQMEVARQQANEAARIEANSRRTDMRRSRDEGPKGRGNAWTTSRGTCRMHRPRRLFFYHVVG